MGKLEIDANNWMGALRAGREQLGEQGGVPPGASCAVAPDGTVTILDPGSRRRFSLTPVGGSPSQPAGAMSSPSIPVATAPSAAPPKQAAPAQQAAPVAVSQPAPSIAADAGAKKKKRFETVAFSPEQAKEQMREVVIGLQPTQLAMPAQSVAASAVPAPQPQAAAAPVAQPQAAADSAAASAQPSVPVAASKTPSGAGMRLDLLVERSEEPTKENPLTYRERAYLVAPGVRAHDAETALRAQLLQMQNELASRPKGKFVNLAVFDHRWDDRPRRPPLVVLQWRDWREEINVDYPAASQASPSRPASMPVEDDRLVGAFEALHDLSLLRTPAEGMDFVLNLLAEMLPTEASACCLYDINTDELRFVAVHGVSAQGVQGKAVPRTAGLFGQAARNEGRPTAFVDVMLEPNYNPNVDGRPGLDARSMLLRPVVDEHHHMLGMLQLINRANTTSFTVQDMNLVNYVAKQLADFLLRVRTRRDSAHPLRR